MVDRQPEPHTRILVVDDNEANRELLSRRLARRGYLVECAADGAAALSALEASTYHAVLLDIMMPDVSGLQVLARIRERRSKTELPVIMATARTGSEDMVEAFRLGANDYVTKPLDFPVVLARLENHLAMRRELGAQSDPVFLLAEEDLPAGTMLDGRYRVDEVIGEGGFAAVYAGEQLSTGQAVAIKLLKPERLTRRRRDEELARFELEVKIIARIQHPAIVRLIDSGTLALRSSQSDSDGWRVPYLVMERLDGETLAGLLRRERRLPIEQAVDLMMPVLHGLHAAHAQGIVHRDSKPSNIFLSRTSSGHGAPKVLDFGIAKLTTEEASFTTQSRVLVGTPEYMSPEQAKSLALDGRSDQYTLGVVLYECLSGQRPYTGTTSVEVLREISDGACVPLPERGVEAPEPLWGALARALSLSPAHRFPDMLAFAEALLPFASPDGRGVWSRLQTQEPSSDVRPAPLELEPTLASPTVSDRPSRPSRPWRGSSGGSD